jgi:hypothetical protein
MMARPRATSLRTNSGVTSSGIAAPKLLPSRSAERPRFSRAAMNFISSVMRPARA